MHAIRWLAAALLLAGLMSAAHAEKKKAPPAPCDPQFIELGNVDLTIAEQPLVPVNLDGHPGYMVANVGDAATYVWKSFAESSDYRVIEGRTVIRGVRLGKTNFGRLRVFVANPLWPAPPDASLNVIGALGMDLLGEVDFELDTTHRKLRLFSPDHCPGNVVYWTHNYASTPLHRDRLGNVSVPMELDQQSVEAMIMTSEHATTLDKHTARRVYGFSTGPDGSNSYVAMKMTAPGLTATNVTVSLEKLAKLRNECTLYTDKIARYSDNCAGIYPMQIGMNVLEKLRMFFANREGVLYYSQADATM